MRQHRMHTDQGACCQCLLIGREDPDISESVLGILQADGIAVHLGARTVGIEPSDGGIATTLEDATGRRAFTHTAYNDSEICVGMTETEAKAGHKTLVGTMAMEDVSRAYEKGETLGLMKIVVDSDTKAILGAAILGTGGDEAVHCVLDMMYAQGPYTLMQRAMHIHPTISEFIPSLLYDLQAR
jgi:pyruvate/2-oxoglutarate dehydrogenase complex dihydrolipoamide dehydrogenase (E3) component